MASLAFVKVRCTLLSRFILCGVLLRKAGGSVFTYLYKGIISVFQWCILFLKGNFFFIHNTFSLSNKKCMPAMRRSHCLSLYSLKGPLIRVTTEAGGSVTAFRATVPVSLQSCTPASVI